MEKLNKIERLKRQLAPIAFDINSCDFSNLSEDERFFLKNYGIYNSKLRPQNFMLRIRLDGGRVNKEPFYKLLLLAKQEQLQVLLTARAGIELHNIKASQVLEIYQYVQSLGFLTAQSLTDNIRAIVTDVYDGLAQDFIIECFSIIKEIQKEIMNNPNYFGMLPRKFNTILIGREKPLMNPWGNDLLFALAKSEKSYGFNIYLGGKNNEVAKSANIFIEAKHAKRLFFAIVDTFIKYGARHSRSKIRFFHLIEELGIKRVRELIEQEYKEPLNTEQELLMQSSFYRDNTPLQDNKVAKILKCHYGELNINKALKLLEDSDELRVGVDQNLHIITHYTKKTTSKGSITACAGARYCPLSLWDIKNDVDLLSLEMFQKEQINIGFSGCLKGCGRHHHNHIGLVGLRSNMFGDTERAIRIFIGATELPKPTPARLLYYAVPVRAAKKLFEIIIKEYKTKKYKDFYEFNALLNHYSIETLQLWFILRQLTSLDKKLIELFHSAKEKELLEALEKLPIYPKDKELYEAVNVLSHLLWDKKET